jgi:hypothetical protein
MGVLAGEININIINLYFLRLQKIKKGHLKLTNIPYKYIKYNFRYLHKAKCFENNKLKSF